MFDQLLFPVSYLLFKILPFIILGVLMFNMVQRLLWKGWGKKRAASFYFALLIAALLGAAVLIMRYKLTDFLLIPVTFGIILFIIAKRNVFFPFKFECIQCGGTLSLKRIVAIESNLCENCEKSLVNGEHVS